MFRLFAKQLFKYVSGGGGVVWVWRISCFFSSFPLKENEN